MFGFWNHIYSFTWYIKKTLAQTKITIWQQKSINRYVCIIKLVLHYMKICIYGNEKLHILADDFVNTGCRFGPVIILTFQNHAWLYSYKDGLDKIGGRDVHHCNARGENKNSYFAENATITVQVVNLFLVNTICNCKFNIDAIHVLLSK